MRCSALRSNQVRVDAAAVPFDVGRCGITLTASLRRLVDLGATVPIFNNFSSNIQIIVILFMILYDTIYAEFFTDYYLLAGVVVAFASHGF